MAKKGCYNGCVHNKEIKLPEMRETYEFRCEAMGCYMRAADAKKSCKLFQPPYKIRQNTIEDFIDIL